MLNKKFAIVRWKESWKVRKRVAGYGLHRKFDIKTSESHTRPLVVTPAMSAVQSVELAMTL